MGMIFEIQGGKNFLLFLQNAKKLPPNFHVDYAAQCSGDQKAGCEKFFRAI
jgi:hypothetical protein